MYKLLLFTSLIAFVTARPGYLDHGASIYYTAPSVIHEPVFAKVGAVVKSIPTSVSHQSSSVVHSSAHYVEPILAPVLKTTYAAPVLHATPIIKSYALPTLHAAHSAGWAW